jgi:uncharacterized ion transporter superfamily protein YfcC
VAWYLNELGAAFFILGLFAAAIGRLGPSMASEKFIEGARQLTETAILVGIARGIALIMEDGQILHTIVHYLSLPLSLVGAELSAVGMMIIQAVLNLFIPSGSGQAFVTMPLMAPLGDLVGVSRQVAVMAYQMGDGFTNMIIPTNAILMGILGMAGIFVCQVVPVLPAADPQALRGRSRDPDGHGLVRFFVSTSR